MRRMHGLWMFYKTFAPATLIISACCCGVFYLNGVETLFSIVLIKGFGGAIIYYAVGILRSRKLVFYYNLHYPPWQLWVAALGIDVLILAFLLIIMQILR